MIETFHPQIGVLLVIVENGIGEKKKYVARKEGAGNGAMMFTEK